jgi:DNA-binding transcriptional ArsR family regulator
MGNPTVIADAPVEQALVLADVLAALSDPIRLRIVVQLADDQEHACNSFGLPIVKSTCSHHFKVLREAGIISQRMVGKSRLNRLRRDALEQSFPGLIDAITGANRG